VREVTDSTFEQDVLGADRPVVVDFWAPWCGPCRAVAPILEQLATSQDRIEFVKVDIDQSPSYASRYGVLSIPTTILFEGGEAKETVIGARPRSYYERAFAPWLAPAT
jgi:thioredoxin 1